jgi:hypothetical protein
MNNMTNNKCKLNKKVLRPFRAPDGACGGDLRYHGTLLDGSAISNFKLYFRLSRPNNRRTRTTFPMQFALPVVPFPGPVTLAGILRAFSAEERNWLDFLIREVKEPMNKLDGDDQSTINVRGLMPTTEGKLKLYVFVNSLPNVRQ